MSIQIKDRGSWKNVSDMYVKDSGTWKRVSEAYVKENGVWKQTYTTVETFEILVSVWGAKGDTTDNPGSGGAFGGKTDLLCKAPLDATFSWILGSGLYAQPDGQGPAGFNRGGAPRQAGGKSGGIGGSSTAWLVNGTVVCVAGGGGSGGQGLNVDYYTAGGRGGNYNNPGETAQSIVIGDGSTLSGGVGGSGFNNGGDGVKGDTASFPGGTAFGGSSGGGGNGLTGGQVKGGQPAATGGGGGGGYLLGGNDGGFLGSTSWVPATNTPSTFGQGGIEFKVVATGKTVRYNAVRDASDPVQGNTTVADLIKEVPTVKSNGVISGDNSIGSTISYAVATFNGYPVPTVTWEWLADSQVVQSGGATYLIKEADANKTLLVRATATNFAGSVSNDSNTIIVGRIPYSQNVTFNTNTTWTAPPGVNTIRVTCFGGGTSASGYTAKGGTAIATMNATSGETFQINFFGGGPSWNVGDSAGGSSGGGSASAFGLYTGSTLDQSTLYMIAGGAGGCAAVAPGGEGGGENGENGQGQNAPEGGNDVRGGAGGNPYGGDNSDRPGGSGGPLSGGRGSEAKSGRCGDYGGASSGGGCGWFGGGGVSGDCGPGIHASGAGGSSRIKIPGDRNPVVLQNSRGTSLDAKVYIEF
jgi:hypothetical protein